jgi:hypothetical protein
MKIYKWNSLFSEQIISGYLLLTPFLFFAARSGQILNSSSTSVAVAPVRKCGLDRIQSLALTHSVGFLWSDTARRIKRNVG